MKKKRSSLSFWFWTAVFILLVVCAVRHFRIKNFKVVQPGVLYTSGQPRGMDYTRLLYKYHIATFVNLRNPTEHREDNWYNEEIIWMRNNGVKYIELPIEKNLLDRGFPEPQDCQKFLEIMSQSSNLPVLVHDSNGKKRVAYLAAVWMLKSGGYNLQQAIEKVQQIKEVPLTEQEIEFLKSLAAK